MTSAVDWRFLGLMVAVAVGLFRLFQNYKDNLKDDAALAEYRQRLAAPAFAPWYQALLGKGLDRLAGWFGPNPFGLRGWGVCITLSMLYSLAAFLLTWLFGGPGTIARRRCCRRGRRFGGG